MIHYSNEVKEMCPVAQGVHHGAAPIPEEAKWVKSKQISDISGLHTVSVGVLPNKAHANSPLMLKRVS